MRHQHGPHAWPHLWPWPYSIHGHGAFHSWPWRIPFMAMAHSTHGHGPIPFMAMALFHSWPWPHSIHGQGPVAVAPHRTITPGKTSPYIRSRIAQASPPRRFRANRSNPGIKSYWRWGWFRGVATVDKGDHGTSYIRICIGHK